MVAISLIIACTEADISLCFITAIHCFQFRFVGRLADIRPTKRYYGRARARMISKMFFVLRFLKQVVFPFRKGKSSIQQGRLESKGTLFTPGDITKNSKILQKVKLIDMIEYSSFPVGNKYFT